jgi:hypothetical protein
MPSVAPAEALSLVRHFSAHVDAMLQAKALTRPACRLVRKHHSERRRKWEGSGHALPSCDADIINEF